MKKILFASLLAMMFVLGACGGGGNEENAQDGTTEEQTDQGTTENGNENANEGENAGENGNAGEGEKAGEGENAGGGEGTVDTAAAEEAFQANCASCHGGDLSGGMGPSLKQVGTKYSSDEIVEIIHNGKGQMPAQGQVSDENAQLIASWLATKK